MEVSTSWVLTPLFPTSPSSPLLPLQLVDEFLRMTPTPTAKIIKSAFAGGVPALRSQLLLIHNGADGYCGCLYIWDRCCDNPANYA